MCVVSMITDHYYDRWSPLVQQSPPVHPVWTQWSPGELQWPANQAVKVVSPISAEEVAEFRRLLERARAYDKSNHEPDCDLAEKKERLLKIAEALGVHIDFL